VVSICTTRPTPRAFGFAQLAFAAVGAGAGAAAAGAGAGVAGAGAAAGAGGGVVRCGIRACDQTLVKAQTETALAAKSVALIRIAIPLNAKSSTSGPSDANIIPIGEPRPTMKIAPTDFPQERWQG